MNIEGNDEWDYAWTTGNDPAVSHQRLIDSGAFGDVHEVDILLQSNR
jgi:hypothetical protein